ncbi:MAG: hypothetical protein IJ091_06140 [Oscillospiraceae bacterium]|nr:hypothetical protein [Oscillospiraceae bacterium]
MSNKNNLEIEYKYLIRFPDLELLETQSDCRKVEIVQTYLLSPKHVTARVRSWTEKGITHYFRTEKVRVSKQTSEEYEKEISEADYLDLLKDADPARKPIHKTRYRIPYRDHMLEIDVYPFWRSQAVLEIEVSEENENVEIPDYLSVLRDVTGKKAYRNAALARAIPEEDLRP